MTLLSLFAPPVYWQVKQTRVAPLRIDGHRLLLMGKPLQIISGELEYARIPRADWTNRLRMVHAMGLNSVAVYVLWNLHEPHPGMYDFTGQNDIAEFIREAAAEGLYVVLRPGSYICGERNLGRSPFSGYLSGHKPTRQRSHLGEWTPARQILERWTNRQSVSPCGLAACRAHNPITVMDLNGGRKTVLKAEDRPTYLDPQPERTGAEQAETRIAPELLQD